jgi:hypothetical protein
MRQRLIELGTAVGFVIAGVGGWVLAQPTAGQALDPPRILLGAASVVSLVLGAILVVLCLLPTAGRRVIARGVLWIGAQVDPETASAERRSQSVLREQIDTLLTWVYRRKHWGPGLSADGRYHEGAPEFYGQQVYDTLGIKRKYKRRAQAIAEPGYDGPPETDRHPGAVPTHGINVRCTGCQWEGAIMDFEAHKKAPPQQVFASAAATDPR